MSDATSSAIPDATTTAMASPIERTRQRSRSSLRSSAAITASSGSAGLQTGAAARLGSERRDAGGAGSASHHSIVEAAARVSLTCSREMRPSASEMTRSAMVAIAALWVMMAVVAP